MTVTTNREVRVIKSNTGFANPIDLDQYVEQSSYVRVFADNVELAIGTHYTIDDPLPSDGISISITPTGLALAPTVWVVAYDPPMEQGANLSLGGRFGTAYEDALDAVVRRLQAMNDKVKRGLRLPIDTPLNTEGGEFPIAQPDSLIGWSADGTALENKGTVPQLQAVSAISAQITAVSAKLTEIEAVAANEVDISTVAGSIGSVNAVGGSIADVNTVAGDIANVNTVATNIADINTVASAVPDIQAAAADLPSLAAKLNIDASNVGDDAARATFRSNIGVAYDDLPWLSMPIGMPFPLMTDKTGVTAPPKDSALYRFVLLTAGEDGAGEYNEGVLTSESVSGSAPLVVATAVIDLDGSPMDGQTISLINTERRFLRAGSAGTTENDAFMSHSHAVPGASGFSLSAGGTFVFYIGGGGSSGASSPITDGTGTPRTATETRPKNIGVTYYMRIK